VSKQRKLQLERQVERAHVTYNSTERASPTSTVPVWRIPSSCARMR